MVLRCVSIYRDHRVHQLIYYSPPYSIKDVFKKMHLKRNENHVEHGETIVKKGMVMIDLG